MNIDFFFKSSTKNTKQKCISRVIDMAIFFSRNEKEKSLNICSEC